MSTKVRSDLITPYDTRFTEQTANARVKYSGNGNAALFQNDDRVQTFSMHCSGNYFSKKETSNLDVELPVGCNDETYLSTLRYWLRRIEQHDFDATIDIDKPSTETRRKNFDLIFFQAGVDIHNDDRLGRLCITTSGISQRNLMVYEFAHRMKCPLVITMGGGYPNGNGKEGSSSIIEAHTRVYCDAYEFLTTAYR
jgi:acetoin utilization deacetylase AcuC-like enzyme